MKITPALRKAINAGVRDIVGGGALSEVGFREDEAGHWVANALNWKADNDLGDIRRLADVKEIEDHPALPGAATLDLYVTTGVGVERQLDRNVYVVIKDGALALITDNTRAIDAQTIAVLGVPFSKD